MESPAADQPPEVQESPEPPAVEAEAAVGPAHPPVVLLHGLAVVKWSMTPLAWRVGRSGRKTHNIGYNSYHVPIPTIAERVARRIRGLGHAEIDVVCHSMGGIVLRWAANHCQLPRLRRVVMIGTPNLGSRAAENMITRLGWLAHGVVGPALGQLRPGDLGIACRAGTLEGVQTGVIAGGTGAAKGMSSRIPGDNDRLVAVEETILAGMNDFIHVRSSHSGQLVNKRVAELVIHYLDHGRFRPVGAPGGDAHREDSPSPPHASSAATP